MPSRVICASSTPPDTLQPDVVLGVVPAQSLNAPRSLSSPEVHTGATTVAGDDDGAVLGCAVGGDVQPIPPVTANNATASPTTKAESRNRAVERLIGQPERWCASPAVAPMVPSPAREQGDALAVCA